MIFLRIPILIPLILFGLLIIYETKLKDLGILKIINKTVNTIFMVYLIWHAFAVSKDIYSLDIIVNNTHTGFVQTYLFSRPISIAIICISAIIFTSVEYAVKYNKYIILIISSVYSSLFAQSIIGIEVCLCIYLTSKCILECNLSQDKKSINQHIISAILAYILISYSVIMPDASARKIMIAIGIVINFYIPPFTKRIYLNVNSAEQMLIIIVQTFNFIIFPVSIVILLGNTSTTGIMAIISLICTLYGGYYAICEKRIVRSIIYFLIVISGNIILYSSIKYSNNNELFKYFGNLMAIISVCIFLIIYFTSKYIKCDTTFEDNIPKMYKILMLFLMSNILPLPFVSPHASHVKLLFNLNIIQVIIYYLNYIMIVLYTLKIYNLKDIYQIKYNIKHILFMFTIFIFCVFDTIGCGVYRIMHAHHGSFVYFYTKIILSILGYISCLFIIQIHKSMLPSKLIENNIFDKILWKIINTAIVVYDTAILYLKNLLSSTNHGIKKDTLQLHSIWRDISISTRNNGISSIISIISLLAIFLCIKMFN